MTQFQMKKSKVIDTRGNTGNTVGAAHGISVGTGSSETNGAVHIHDVYGVYGDEIGGNVAYMYAITPYNNNIIK